MTDALTLERFAPHVGEAFKVTAPSGDSAEINLVEANDLTEKMKLPEGMRNPFELYFHGPEGLMIEQGTYEVSHPKAGTHNLFLVPVQATDAPGPCAFAVTIA